MKKWIYAMLAVAFLALLLSPVGHKAGDTFVPAVNAAGAVCDQQQSLLCASLVGWWDMEESAHAPRYDSLSGRMLLESDNATVA